MQIAWTIRKGFGECFDNSTFSTILKAKREWINHITLHSAIIYNSDSLSAHRSVFLELTSCWSTVSGVRMTVQPLWWWGQRSRRRDSMLATIRCGGLSSEGRSGWRSVGQVDDLASHVLMQLLLSHETECEASRRVTYVITRRATSTKWCY